MASRSPEPVHREPMRIERTTTASRQRSASTERKPSPDKLLMIPDTVLQLSTMSARDRVLLEDKQRKASKGGSRARSAAFADSNKMSPQRAKRDENAAARQKHLIEEANKKNRNKPPSYDELKKESGGSSWAKSKLPRGSYQYSWKNFPTTVPQPSIINGTPGPGAYGASTSFAQ